MLLWHRITLAPGGLVSFLAPYFIPLPFLFLELFVGAIQAFIFAMITLVSISLHISVHDEGHDAHH